MKVEGKDFHKIVGTPDYMAPEMINSVDGNNPSIDWWAIGCILYELIIGMPPFNDKTVDKVWENVVHCRIAWPEIGYDENCISPEAKDLIERLLQPDLSKRIRSIEELKSHPFFEGGPLLRRCRLEQPQLHYSADGAQTQQPDLRQKLLDST
jgi:serine/threonine protein kinase